MKMTAREEEKQLSGVSKTAQRIYRRIKNDSRFYKAFGKWDNSKAMQELVNARLVQIGGRVNVMVACYVPIKGFKPLQLESWDGQQ